MPSAVLPSTDDVPPIEPLSDIKHLAAEGYFQAVAYWLNHHLVSQKVYAQVLEDEQPGRLRILIEFERAPQPERLLRFVCDRLYKLESDVIEGAYLIARPLGTKATVWEKSVRIPTATERQTRLKKQRSRPSLLHESVPAQAARRIIRNQFNFFRAALVTGTAAIALAFGGLTELVVAGKLVPTAQTAAQTATQTATQLETAKAATEPSWYANDSDDAFAGDSLVTDASLAVEAIATPAADSDEALAVSFRPASRFEGRTVEAALETVAVVPHDVVADPADPTITLLFGGELGLNDFIFEDASSIDNLFSEVELYQQADISMIGLAEPLANASTSLQEDFYHRTRPQAVQLLKAGGIDIVSLASEGSMTYGSNGLDETLNTLDRQGIYRVGAGRNQQEAHRPEILEVKGQRIAYLGYNPAALKGAQEEKAGVAIATSEERQHIIEDIRAIRSQVDWVVVNYRWGEALDNLTGDLARATEIESEPPQIVASPPADWQRSLAHEAVDAGADLVVGYHPSHIQGAEIYRDRAIAYSLGDFVFDQSPLQDHDTAALRVSLRNQQMKVEFLPVIIRDSKLQTATGDRALSILKAIRNASSDFEQPMRFPTVLKAKPNLKLPDALRSPEIPTEEPQPSDSDYPSAPDPFIEDPFIEKRPASEPTTHPAMQESEALFSPQLESETEALEIESFEVKPLEAEPLEVDPLETTYPDIEASKIEPLEADSLEADSPYPSLEGESAVPFESVAPFIDPFLDPAYDSPADSIEPYAEPLVGPISALPVPYSSAEPADVDLSEVEPLDTNRADIEPSIPESSITESPTINDSPPKPKAFND